jgi:cystinosin
MIKVVLTTIKYTPQAVMNYRRKSTAGFSIWAILLDLSGGVLSLAQLQLDSSLQTDRSGIIGNASKLMLGNVTVLFDFVFIFQHYCLYHLSSVENMRPSEEDPLLQSNGSV